MFNKHQTYVEERGDQATENARLLVKAKKKAPTEHCMRNGFGVHQKLARAPRKLGWWGNETSRGKRMRLTISAFSFPQFTQIHSKIFFTLIMNPESEDERPAA
jgi:hypothetical protein